jgi:hypothetical protein
MNALVRLEAKRFEHPISPLCDFVQDLGMTLNADTQPFHLRAARGWFDAPYIRAMLDTESADRLRDIEGPQSDELVDRSGWSFAEEPLHVALVDPSDKAVAAAWIAATTRGLNLTYVVAHCAQHRGLATWVTAWAVLVYAKRGCPDRPLDTLTAHAQYDATNQASAGVAHRLGLLPEPLLAFTVGSNPVRQFIGSEAPWSRVLAQAQQLQHDIPPGYSIAPTDLDTLAIALITA